LTMEGPRLPVAPAIATFLYAILSIICWCMCGEGCSDDETMMGIEEVRPTREAYMLYIYHMV
jgi:hypothetical protein